MTTALAIPVARHIGPARTFRHGLTLASRSIVKIKKSPAVLLDVTIQPILFLTLSFFDRRHQLSDLSDLRYWSIVAVSLGLTVVASLITYPILEHPFLKIRGRKDTIAEKLPLRPGLGFQL